MKARVFATLGPASLRGDALGALEERVDGFRIDLAQRSPDEVDGMIDLVRRHARSVPVVLNAHAEQLDGVIVRDSMPNVVKLAGHHMEAIEAGVCRGVRRFALSSPDDAGAVQRLRSSLPDDALVLAVIDTASSWHHRLDLMEVADGVVLDRGALAGAMPTEYLPYRQKAFVRYGRRSRRPVFIANGPVQPMAGPGGVTVAQANDIARNLRDGARGFVLTAETATGADPVGAVDALLRCLRAFEHSTMATGVPDLDAFGRNESGPGAAVTTPCM